MPEGSLVSYSACLGKMQISPWSLPEMLHQLLSACDLLELPARIPKAPCTDDIVCHFFTCEHLQQTVKQSTGRLTR